MSNDLTKYEVSAVAQKAGCAWLHEPLAQRFATLCRVPLVAEVERLKQAHEINADTLNAMQVEIDDWKARALKSEQAVAEWQGSADGGKSWRRIDKPRGESIESRVAHLRNMTNSQGRPIYLIRALYTTPKPAAQESPSAVPVVEQLVEASTMLLSYTLACEGLLNAKPAGQIDIAQEAIAAGQQYLKENGK
jgi:hypothetical protein